MTTKNSLNVIREMTSLTNKFLQKGYQILEVHSDPNNGQNLTNDANNYCYLASHY